MQESISGWIRLKGWKISRNWKAGTISRVSGSGFFRNSKLQRKESRMAFVAEAEVALWVTIRPVIHRLGMRFRKVIRPATLSAETRVRRREEGRCLPSLAWAATRWRRKGKREKRKEKKKWVSVPGVLESRQIIPETTSPTLLNSLR